MFISSEISVIFDKAVNVKAQLIIKFLGFSQSVSHCCSCSPWCELVALYPCSFPLSFLSDSLFFIFLLSSIFHKCILSLHPQPCLISPSFPLSLFLLSTVINPRTRGPPGPHPSFCHPCIPCLSCSPCQLDSSSPWSHPVVLTNHTTVGGGSTNHAPNLVSFVFSFQPACIMCLLPVMVSARVLRSNAEQGKLHNPALKELSGSPPVHLAMLFPVSGMTTVLPSPKHVKVYLFFKTQFTALSLPWSSSSEPLTRSYLFCY